MSPKDKHSRAWPTPARVGPFHNPTFNALSVLPRHLAPLPRDLLGDLGAGDRLAVGVELPPHLDNRAEQVQRFGALDVEPQQLVERGRPQIFEQLIQHRCAPRGLGLPDIVTVTFATSRGEGTRLTTKYGPTGWT